MYKSTDHGSDVKILFHGGFVCYVQLRFVLLYTVWEFEWRHTHVINMNRSRLLLSVKYIDCAVFVSPHILAHFQSSIKINWQLSVFELKNAAGEENVKNDGKEK